MQAQRRPSSGFTLVEMLVVVAIVAALVTIAVPALRAARGAAQSGVCAANLRQCFGIARAFASDHDGLGPAIGQPYAALPNWALLVQDASGVRERGGAAFRERSALVCPGAAAAHDEPMTRTYAMNATGHNRQSAWNDDPDSYDIAPLPNAPHVGIRLDSVPFPGRSPLLIDAARNPQSPPLPAGRCASVIDFREDAAMADRIGRWHASGSRSAGRLFQCVMVDGSSAAFAEPPPSFLTALP